MSACNAQLSRGHNDPRLSQGLQTAAECSLRMYADAVVMSSETVPAGGLFQLDPFFNRVAQRIALVYV